MKMDDQSLPSLFCHLVPEEGGLGDDLIKTTISAFLDAIGPREDVMILPPDFTRYHSQAGMC